MPLEARGDLGSVGRAGPGERAELLVHARCVGLRGARFRYEYAIARGEELLADGFTEHACVNAQTFRPTRVPDWLAQAIRAAEASASPSA